MRSSSPPPPNVLAFARALRRERRARDLKQEALATRAGMSAKHLGEIERGLRDPRLSTVLGLVDALEPQSGGELSVFWRQALRLGGPAARAHDSARP
jgi:transcriptional regulator with XRE-family HTH domain